MNNKLVKVSELQRVEVNPFMDKFVINQGRRSKVVGRIGRRLVDEDTGEVLSGNILSTIYEDIDKTKFIKLFIGEVGLMFELSKPALRVFGYIINHLKPNTDEIYLHTQQMTKYCNYKQPNAIYRGLSDLAANGIIIPSTLQNKWFINPAFIFNGDRLLLVKEYRKKEVIKDEKSTNLVEEPRPTYGITDSLIS